MEFCGIHVSSPFFLAPMAGITDSAFRSICAGRGAALTYTEMVSAKALVYQDKKTHELLSIHDDHRPCALQLFGSEPEIMAQAAAKACALSRPEIIDINMGCPVPKIVNNGEGSALMKDFALSSRIIRAVSDAVTVPVTVKFRMGFYAGERTAPDFAKMAQDSGAAAVCIHGRTRSQMYLGQSDMEIVSHVKAAVSIPVVASGDAKSGEACNEILRQTGADAVMIARGALGFPLIFDDCLALWRGESPLTHTVGRLMDILDSHAALTCGRKGESRAMPELRKHVLWYLGRISGAKAFKSRVGTVSRLDELLSITAEVRQAGLKLKTEVSA